MSENTTNFSNMGGQAPYPVYFEKPKKKSNWWIPLLIVGIVLVLLLMIVLAVFGVVGSFFEKEQVEVKSNSVLYLNFTGLNETSPNNPFAFLGGDGKNSFYEVLSGIERAKFDDKIKGIYIESNLPGGLSPVKAAEIQDALEDFRKSGKFIYAYIEAGNESNYFNALPANKIIMPKEGMLEFNGFGIASLFFKGLFNKYGVDFYVQHFEDFKSAGESFSKAKFSDSARKQLQVILDNRQESFVESVSKYRKMEKAAISAAMSRGLYSADSLKANGLIDEIANEATVKEMIKKEIFGKNAKSDDKVQYVGMSRYLASDPPLPGTVAEKDKKIAVIYASGAISSGRSQGFSNESEIKSGEFIKYLKDAREDNNVKAIIIRIDSPGGSVIASDEIWNEIVITKKVKPVYASMSDVAASGGYYMAMACDTIFAHPQTITGSIGVILMIPNLSGLANQFGVTVDTISTSPSANFMNPLMPFSEKDKKQLYDVSYDIYKRFVDKAANSRKKSFEELRSVAKGRVWTGTDAKRLGLVDMLGGIKDAIKLAKHRIGVPDSVRVYLKTYPSKEDDVKSILRLFGLNPDEDEDAGVNINAMAAALGISKNDFLEQWALLPDDARKQMIYTLQMLEMSKKEKVLMAVPNYYSIK